MQKLKFGINSRQLFAVLILAGAGNVAHANQWQEVDDVRAAAGMLPLAYSEALSVAAGNHAAYLVQNLPLAHAMNVSAHDESSSAPLFSGVSASDRALYAGYPHKQVSENISTGNDSARESVRSLMAAIYHRFGFLSFDVDAIGIAEQSQRYVYNMGRSDLEQTCLVPSAASQLQSPASCQGVPMLRSAHAQLCQNLPAEARFVSPYSRQCPDGTRLNKRYIEDLCAAPPTAALHRGSGRYYQLCDNQTKFKASWFENLCAAPPLAAAYQQSGSYYEICAGYGANGLDPALATIKVDADWYVGYCANLPTQQRYQDSGRFYKPCANDIKVRAEYMDHLDFELQVQNPEFVLWPVSGASDIPPVFFEESPDPLPDFSVSGYPISLQFNPAFVKAASIIQFNLEQYIDDSSGGVTAWQAVRDMRFLNAQSDPNKKFEALQFAWFPLQRLAWGAAYRVSISALVDGESRQYYSEFTTQVLDMPLLTVYSDTRSIATHNGEWLALYQAPSANESQPFQNVNFSYPAGARVELDLIDVNTIKLQVTGARCRPVTLTLSSGRQLQVQTCGG